MKMLIVALLGGVVLGFIDAKLLTTQIHSLVTNPATQGVATAAVAAFLGVLWGWVAKGMIGGKPKD